MANNIRNISDNDMRVKDIIETHPLYDQNLANWNFLMASYEGTRQLVKLGYLKRHERESLKNYERRLSEAYGFGYSRSIIDLFNFYLFKKPVKREMASLKEDDLWNSFVNDCDLDGTSLDDFLTEQNKYAAIYGTIGILVDRAQDVFENKADQKDAGVYPYLSAYSPSAVLDWDFDRDQYNRPYLSYLKLVDDDNRYFLWWIDKFKIFILPESDDSGNTAWLNSHVVKVREATNPISVIPFIWLYNMKGNRKPIGVSDIEEVARIDRSIMRNLSDGEEIITYASFPMMRKPAREMRPDGAGSDQGSDDIGATAILEFDPDHPESKPDWLTSEVAAPVDAIAKWIANKVSEIYRATNAGGMAGMEVSTAPKSGAALQAEFQLLNASLVRKAKNLENAEKKIIYYWLLWEEQAKEIYKDVIIERSRTYDVENLAADLENTMTATVIVKSEKFAAAVQKQIVRQMLPAFNDQQISEIDEEIDSAPSVESKPPIIEEEE